MTKPRLSARERLLRHFEKNLGRVMDSDELREVGAISEWARRVRELRADGYAILTHHDRATLKPGEYVMENATPQPVFASGISKETRAIVLDRNGFTCQMCGAAAGEPHPYDYARKVRLHLGHIVDRSKGGDDSPGNLRAICSVCNEGLQNVSLMRPDLKALLIHVRRATVDDQRAVLRWLKKKFEAAPPASE